MKMDFFRADGETVCSVHSNSPILLFMSHGTTEKLAVFRKHQYIILEVIISKYSYFSEKNMLY